MYVCMISTTYRINILNTMCNWALYAAPQNAPGQMQTYENRKGNTKGQDRQEVTYILNGENLQRITKEKDIGVITDSDLSFDDHISEQFKKANFMF